MSLTNTTGRPRYVAPLLLIVAVAACSKQDEAAPATTPAAATPAAPPPPAVSAEVQAMDADALREAATKALRENRIWGNKERHYERVLPHASDAALGRLLQSAHWVDGIVKGLKVPDWPQEPWQALQRLFHL